MEINPTNHTVTEFKSEKNEVIDLMPLAKTIWRKKWGILSIVILTMLLASLVTMSINPTYRATATMQIDQQEAQVVSIEKIYGINDSNEYLQTQFELLKSRALAERVVKELKLTTHKDFDPRQAEPPMFDIKGMIIDFDIHNLIPGLLPEDFSEDKQPTDAQVFDRVVRTFMSKITIEPIRKSQLVKISVDMHDRKLAAQAANALGHNYISSQLDAEMEASITATNWMNERLVELKNNLQESENKLQAFKDKEGLIDVDGIVTVTADELSAINNRLVDARAKLAEIQSQHQQVKSIDKADWQKLSSMPAVLSNRLIQQFKTEEARAKAKVDELSKRYGKRHPTMQAALSELASAQASLKSQVEQVVASIKRQYQIASANVWSLKRSVETNKSEIQDISRNEFKLRELQREIASNRAIFDTFMNRLKETAATADIESTNARIVDSAVIPSWPIKPNTKMIVILFGLLAGLLAVFLTIVLYILNNTFKSVDEVESKLNLPVLGILPKIKKSNDVSIAQTFHKNADKIFAECIRTIRTSVMLSSIDKHQKIVMVTSSIPGEGKSATSINIADAMGQMEKTLLLEADMRRPTVSKVLNLMPGTPGLANLIAGNATYEECVQELYGGIDTIAAGIVPPNPLELLASDRFKEVIKELEEKYDRIIIDCPPVSAVSDAVLLSTMAESVIFVIHSDSTDQKIVQKSVGTLLQNNAPVKGVILNKVDIQKSKKQGYTYSGYYDYYGYTNQQ